MPFQKGSDPNRNLNGRPRVGNSVADLARKVLAEKKKGASRETRIMRKAAEMAEEGSVQHMNFLFDRGYGKPQESMQLSGGLSMYESGTHKPFDPVALQEAMKRLSGSTK